MAENKVVILETEVQQRENGKSEYLMSKIKKKSYLKMKNGIINSKKKYDNLIIAIFVIL